MTTTIPTRSPIPTAREAGDGGPDVRPVVVGVDGSECGLRAVRWAAGEAERRAAPLRIVHASAVAGRRGVAGAAPRGLPLARGVTAQAFTVARHTAPSVRTSTDLVPGDPVPTLVRAAVDAQLLVLGISTTGASDEMVLAPVAQRVVARSPQPVVVVPRRSAAAAAGRPLVAVLGIDRSGADERIARFAAEAARRTRSPLTVLHARSRSAADRTAGSDAWTRDFPDLRIAHRELAGASGNDVLAAACPTPLLVLDAGHGGLLHRPLDALHRWLLRHCTSPLALVPPVGRVTGLEPHEDVVALG